MTLGDTPRYVAFLRAINTPPRHVKMDRLREVFESLEFENVTTFIASGNVIFDSVEKPAIEAIEAALHVDLGFEVPTFLRTGPEVLEIVATNPFPDAAELEVSLLMEKPEPENARALEATAGGSDRLKVIGREVYWAPGGRRKDSDHSENRVARILGMQTTRRAFRTVERISERVLR